MSCMTFVRAVQCVASEMLASQYMARSKNLLYVCLVTNGTHCDIY